MYFLYLRKAAKIDEEKYLDLSCSVPEKRNGMSINTSWDRHQKQPLLRVKKRRVPFFKDFQNTLQNKVFPKCWHELDRKNAFQDTIKR